MTDTVHTARDASIEAWLDGIGATWIFEPDLDLKLVDQAAGLANQVRHEPLNQVVVERYTADMKRGDVFPPLLVHRTANRLATLGGNHRYAARLAANHTTTTAYLIECSDDVALRIRVEDNRRHGLPTTDAERLEHGVALMAIGMTQKEAAAIVGVAQPKLSIAVATVAAARRADRLDVAGFARLPERSRYALSLVSNDEVFVAAADLALDAALSTKDITDLVRATNATEPAEALRFIGAEAADHEPRSRAMNGNVRRSSRTARSRFDAALTEIIGLDPADIVATCPPADRARLAQRVMTAAAVLHPTHQGLSR